jgi:hypothetical protein
MFQQAFWKIVKLFFIAIWVISFNGQAQIVQPTEKSYEWVRGIRIGCDVSRFGLPFFQKGRTATEFSIDTELKRNFTPTFETGFENSKINNDRITYSSNGIYGRIGFDYNILKHEDPTNRHSFFVGIRYGFAASKQQTTWNIEGDYWGKTPNGSSSDIIGTHWMELVVGLKVEVLKNFFLGWSLRERILFSSTSVENYALAIPGYGNGGKSSNLGMNYSLYYSIPIMKVKGKIKVEAKD